MLKVFVFLFSLLIWILPYNQLIELHKYAFFVYFLPIFPLIKVFKKGYELISKHRFIFNKKTDQIFFDDRLINRISNVKQLEWNARSSTDIDESLLELKTYDNLKITLSSTINSLNSEHLEVGRQLAKFLKVKFLNNRPYEKEVLWGNFDVDQKDIDQIENKYY